jgi:hypothetical protein
MSGNFDPLYDRGSSLDFVTAAYSGLEISRSLAPFSIDTNGYLFGQTFSGCEIEGQISVIDTSANVYDVTATAANCPGGLSGNLEGLAFAADSSVTNDVLVLGVFNDAAAILGMPKKIGGPFFQTAKLLASDGKAYDHFGSSIALDGDVLVASSVPNDEFGEHAGAIYVFSSIGPGTWTEQAKIGPSDAAAGDYFGSHIDIDGDTIIVHSPFNDNDNGDNAGAAYVFVSNSPQSWIEQAKLTPDDGFHGDRFGRPALSGNIAVLGASWDSVVASYSGSAYVFSRDAAGRWTQETQLLPLDGVERGYFGKSTAIDVNTAVVGSRHDYEGGGVYVYERDESSNWTHTTKLVPGAFQADFGFGSNVALDGQTLLVSAPHEDFGGAVYVYEKDATGIWSQQARLSPSDERTGGWRGGFGPADLDGDTAVIGSPLADNGRLGGTGAAYVFRRDSSGNWNEVVKITAIDSSNDDRFGASVEIEGNTIAIGSPEDGENGNKSGAVYFFRLTD